MSAPGSARKNAGRAGATTVDPFADQVAAVETNLRGVSNIVRQRGREILSHFDITPPQFNALLSLIRGRSLTMGELCQQLFLASSTVTDLVDRMERHDLVQRVRDPQDRRIVRLVVRPKGQSVVDEVMRHRLNYLSGVLSKLDTEERTRLLTALSQVHELMKAEEARVIRTPEGQG